MNVRVLGCVASLGLTILSVSGVACSSKGDRSGFGTDTNATSDGNGAGGNGNGFGGVEAGAGAAGNTACAINNTGDPEVDSDGDGYPLKYDCNECDPNVNNGAFDVPGNGIDEDCNGVVDDEPANCDMGLTIGGTDAFDGAKAMGLCKKATSDQMWGVLDAKWVKPDGSAQSDALGEGILTKFGVNAPQAGAALLALSSGTARGKGDPGYKAPGGLLSGGYEKGYTSGLPAGYTAKVSASCPGVKLSDLDKNANDGAGLQVTIRVPSNAKSFKYQENFFTFEFPGYICSQYNDFFVAIMTPKPASLTDSNIAFDQDSNPISVNNSFLQVCTSQSAGGKNFACPLGAGGLSGTPFEGHAATGWLTTTAPVDTLGGKEITLLWTVWDQNDFALDSTVLVDDFQWSVDAANGTKTAPSPPK